MRDADHGFRTPTNRVAARPDLRGDSRNRPLAWQAPLASCPEPSDREVSNKTKSIDLVIVLAGWEAQ